MRFKHIYLLIFFLSLNVQSCSDDTQMFLESVVEEENPSTDSAEPNEKEDPDDNIDDSTQDDSGTVGDDNTSDPDSTDDPVDQGTIDPTIEIATWKNFAASAVSHTWDDAYKQQVDIAIPLFDEFDMHTTLFVLPNNIDNWDPYRTAYLNGHEIASHTMSHPDFDKLSATEVEYQLSRSQEVIFQNMEYNDCLTLAYPYCHADSFNLTEKYYIAARTCQSRIEKSTPDNFMEVAAFLCGEGSAYYTADQLNSIARSAKDQTGWGVYMFHLIDGTGGYSIDSEVLRQHLTFLSSNPQDYWVDSFLNVVKYIKQRNVAEIRLVEENSNQIVLSYSDILDDEIFDFPITFKRMISSDLQSDDIQVFQDSKECESFVVEEMVNGSLKRFIVFNAVPDSGNIVIQL
ncbi:polysaccharide deacetylase family protein [Allomuricauda sp.]|uniref:polysaccharide deacetylase family protein n=1 Tax=Flagellimonas alginolytica TaxID=3177515 RepID=UPI0025EF164E|nr:polysaccharide deacetylase family protein [Allomuricauda sp.]